MGCFANSILDNQTNQDNPIGLDCVLYKHLIETSIYIYYEIKKSKPEILKIF